MVESAPSTSGAGPPPAPSLFGATTKKMSSSERDETADLPSQAQTHVTVAADRAVEAAQRGDWPELERMFATRRLVTPNYKDAEDCALLHWAAINNRMEVCKELLSRGAQVSIMGGVLVSTPLHWAARVGATETAALLISRGADTRLRDAQGYCPIHLAVQGAHTPLVAYMITRDPHCLNLTDNSGMTPAMWAAFRLFSMFPLRLLVQAGADVNAHEHLQGNTALHMAVQERNHQALEQLAVADNLELDAKNRDQESALDVARARRDHRMLERLEEEAERRRRRRILEEDRQPPTGANLTTKARWMWRRVSSDERTSQALHFAAPGLILGLIALVLSLDIAIIFPILLVLIVAVSLCTVGRAHVHRAMHGGKSLMPLGVNVAEATVLTVGWWPWFAMSAPWWLHVLFILTAALYWTTVVRLVRYRAHMVPLDTGRSTFCSQLEAGRINAANFCFTCWCDRPNRTHHCRLCMRCVRDFDHHCPWIANCVSRQNQRVFLLFVLSVFLLSVLVLGAFVHRCQTDVRSWLHLIDAWRFLWFSAALCVLHVFWTLLLISVQIRHIANRTSTYESIKNARTRGDRPQRAGQGSDEAKMESAALLKSSAENATSTSESSAASAVSESDAESRPSATANQHSDKQRPQQQHQHRQRLNFGQKVRNVARFLVHGV